MNEEKEMLENGSRQSEAKADESTSPDAAPIVNPEIEALNTKIAELNDKYMRALADAENTRRRAGIDSESAARGRAISIAEKFLPLIDAIVAAASHAPDDEGIKSLSAAANGALTSVGITKIETVGQILNPIFHNVIMLEKSDAAENTITRELQSGYMFGESVLRPAMVAVAKKE